MRKSSDFGVVIQKLLKSGMELKLFITEQGYTDTREYRITEANLDFGMATIDSYAVDNPDEIMMLAINDFADDCVITTHKIACTYCHEDSGINFNVVVRPYGFDAGFIGALAQ